VADNEMAPSAPGARRWTQYWRTRHLLILLIMATLVFVAGGSGWLWLTTPDVGWLRTTNPQTTAMMRHREQEQGAAGEIGRPRRDWVGLSRMSPYLIQSVVQAEDPLFFDHKGFDWESMWKALLANLWEHRIVLGGSTLTQQVAKNIFLEPSRTPTRKFKEALLSFRLERELTKARILELYLNIVEWGPGVYGAEAAARAYFNKSAADLRLSEAIRLAAVLPNPQRLSPLDSTHPYLHGILKGMLTRGWVSRATHEQVTIELRDLGASQAPPPVMVALPHPLTGKFRDSDYWVGKMSTPDGLVMNAAEIADFNDRALMMSGGTRVRELPDILSRKEVTDKILEVGGFFPLFGRSVDVAPGNAQVRYDRGNQALGDDFYRRVVSELNLEGVPSHVETRYGLVTRRTDVLAWPVDELVMDKPGDYAFNAILQSTVYPGTPIAIVHTSRDGKWAFIRSAYFDGWTKEESLARTTREDAGAYPGSRFLVVTAPSVRSMSGVELMMGTTARMVERSRGAGYLVKIPTRGKDGELVLLDDVVPAQGISEGFVPYTRRNILVQAFKLLDAPYSWGGSNVGFDCSTYVYDVFAVFGIRLPRSSTWQAQVGRRVARFEEGDRAIDRLDTVHRWGPGVTLLRLPGHIMIYLGEEAGKPYAIHAVWGVKDRDGKIMKIDKVAVTDLDLGRGAKDGSLLERITDVREVALGSSDFRTLIRDFADWLSVHPLRVAAALSSIITVMLFVGAVRGLTGRRFRRRA
jgi:monofunctional glycosyltransferase